MESPYLTIVLLIGLAIIVRQAALKRRERHKMINDIRIQPLRKKKVFKPIRVLRRHYWPMRSAVRKVRPRKMWESNYEDADVEWEDLPLTNYRDIDGYND